MDVARAESAQSAVDIVEPTLEAMAAPASEGGERIEVRAPSAPGARVADVDLTPMPIPLIVPDPTPVANPVSRPSRRAVFFDAERRRWPLVRNAAIAIGAVTALLMASLVARVLIAPVLPSLGLAPGVATAKPAAPRVARRLTPDAPTAGEQTTRPTAIASASVLPGAAVPAAADAGRYAWFVNWDEMAMVSLRENITRLDGLFPEWLHLAGADGAVEEEMPNVRSMVLELAHDKRPGLRILPTVDNWHDTALDVDRLTACLRDATATAALVDRLVAYAREIDSAGICVAFAGVPADAREAYLDLLRRLGERLRADGRALAVSAPADDATFPYAAVAQVSDLVLVTILDQHQPTPGAIAPRAWFDRVLAERAAQIPREKLIVAFGAYGYDWADGSPVEQRSFESALLIARKRAADVAYDAASGEAGFAYADDRGVAHRLVLRDAVSAVGDLAAIHAAGARAALMRLGTEDSSLWPIFAGESGSDAAALKRVAFRYQVQYDGEGEVTAVTGTPADGERDVTFARDGRLASARFAKLPAPYIVTRYGLPATKQIALTFDDGPDPAWTPQVLDVLRAKAVQATFFTIGRNARDNPALVRRIAAEGHEIGNHSYTHPQLSRIGAAQVRAEVTMTERVIEGLTGRRTVLFRQPYAEDVEARSMAEVERLRVLHDLGYVTVGMGVDSEDWRRRGADAIVQQIVGDVESGAGRIVLMHDAGGDRAQTVAALPRVIDELRARGWSLVPVSTLIGRTHDEVMPRLAGGELALARMTGAGFEGLSWIAWAFSTGFLIATALGVARLAAICALAVAERRRAHGQAPPTHHPRVAVLIPAYNEEKVINATVESLLRSDYPGPLEIIVVDDGSKDGTHRIVSTRYAHERRVRTFRKENGGKPEALNYAITKTDAEILVALDADTVFMPDTIAKLVRHFADPTVGAVAGNAKVGNRVNLLTRWQALEYVTSQNLDRRAFHLLNSITVVPGAVGAWRRSVVQEIGGFTVDTLAEDADLTMAILKRGWRILYDDEAIALTEAPESIGSFVKQRYRWMFGTAQAAWKHRHALLRRRFGALGLIALPNVLVFQILFPLIAPIVDLTLLASLAETAVSVWQRSPLGADPAVRILLYWGLFAVVDLIAGLIAFRYEPKEDKKLLWWLVPQRFLYRQLLYYVAIKATLSALRGREVGWGKLDRTASVRVPVAT